MLADNNRWAIRLWIAAIGLWLVIDAGRQWHASSNATNLFVPPTATTAAMTDRYATWFAKFAKAPKRTDGLPVTDLPDIFQKAGEPAIRPPASKRANGNLLELYRQDDGTIVAYDVSADKGYINIKTTKPVTRFTAGHDGIMQPLISVAGGVAFEIGLLPLSFFEGAFRDRRTILQLYDAAGTRHDFLQLSLEDSAEISVFKGLKPQSPLGKKSAEDLLLTFKERRAKDADEHFQRLKEGADIRNISDGLVPSPTPRSCDRISPVLITTRAAIDGRSTRPGMLGYDPASPSVTIRGIPLPPATFTLEIEVPVAGAERKVMTQQTTTAGDTLKVPFASIPADTFAARSMSQLRLMTAAATGGLPDVGIYLTAKQLHDVKLCHENPTRKLSDTVGKD